MRIMQIFFTFFKNVLNYIDLISYQEQPGTMDFSYSYIGFNHFDYAYLYMIYLLYRIDRTNYRYINHEIGGPTIDYFRTFVKETLPCVLKEQFKYFSIDTSLNRKLVTQIKNPQNTTSNYTCLFVEYPNGTCPLYIKYENKYYSLQSSL